MAEPTPRFWEIFHEVFGPLPRQGPGSRACAARALALCRELPPCPAVVDLGCGAGGQTLHLAELCAGRIVALEAREPALARLRAALLARGLERRVLPLVGDMRAPPLPDASLDLVWSEGALYSVGLEPALRVCHDLLRPGGYLAFTDAVWRRPDPPPAVKASFDLDYPTMGAVPDVLATIARAGFTRLDHFTLPDDAWWDDFYTPMERRIEELRRHHAGDAEALAALDQLAEEPAMHRRHADYYAYEFFVARR